MKWLLTWSRLHQEEIRKGEAELKAAWRSGRQSSGRSRATANVARAGKPQGKQGTNSKKKKGNCNRSFPAGGASSSGVFIGAQYFLGDTPLAD